MDHRIQGQGGTATPNNYTTTSTNATTNTTNTDPIDEDHDTIAAVPVPMEGVRLPQSWNEAYGMMKQYSTNMGHCTISKYHPQLGQFVTDIRHQHQRLYNPAHTSHNSTMKERNNNNYKKRDDLTRISTRRVSKLTKLGFDFNETASTLHQQEDGVDGTTILKIDFSDDDDDDDDDTIENQVENDSIQSESSSSSLSEVDITNDDDIDDSDSEDYSVDDDDEQIVYVNDGTGYEYDAYLMVSSIYDIFLSDTCNTNLNLIRTGQPTFPIHLCRLLNSSYRLGFNHIICWSEDGNSFYVHSESEFVQHILMKTTKMTKFVSLRNALGQFNIISAVSTVVGSNSQTFQHRSIMKAEQNNDPSQRQFYRGVSVAVLRTIQSRRDKLPISSLLSSQSRFGTSSNMYAQPRPVKKRNHSDNRVICSANNGFGGGWQDDTYDIANLLNAGERMTSSGRRIITVDRFSNHDAGENKTRKEGTNNTRNKNYTEYNPVAAAGLSYWLERKSRRTQDGCLHPKGGKEKYLLEDGTYERPKGKVPVNLAWDKRRGLWVPLERLKNSNYNNDSSYDLDESREAERKRRRTNDGCLRPKGGKEQLLLDDGTYAMPKGAKPQMMVWNKFRGLWTPPGGPRDGGLFDDDDDDDSNHYHSYNNNDGNVSFSSSETLCQQVAQNKGLSREAERKLRRLKDGSLIPIGGKDMYLLDDGTYSRPNGSRPKGLIWDSFRGLWVPPNRLSTKKRKRSEFLFDENDYDPDDDEFFLKHERRHFHNRRREVQARRTRHGCLLPRRQPIKNLDDGTYFKPYGGSAPTNMYWDSIRGLWVPNNVSSLSFSSSSETATILRSSQVNMLSHTTPMWRSFFLPQTHRNYRNHPGFQARTKLNPTGIAPLAPKLNTSNWGKIEMLMHYHRVSISSTINNDDDYGSANDRTATSATIAESELTITNSTRTYSDDGHMHLV